MKAIVVEAENLSLQDVPDPSPAAGEVVIDVVAAGVNRADLLQRAGNYPPPPGASEIMGLEVSGRISAVGEGVSGWQVGDEVCALLAGGGYAEKVAVPAEQVMQVPRGVDLVSAAALPEVACTVSSNVFDTAGLSTGELLLIHGGSSGIGTHATQVAHAMGARVAVTARNREKLERCREFGAEILIEYTSEDFAAAMKEHGGADVILDIIGAKYLDRNVSALAKDGHLVIIGMQGGVKGELNIGKLLGKRGNISATGLRYRDRADKARIVAATVEHVWPLLESGAVTHHIDRVVPVADAASAHRALLAGEITGKAVLAVD